MKNVLLLLLVVGALAAGWLNRDKWMPKKAAEEEVAVSPELEAIPVGTPHPALEARATVTKVYPALAVPNSPFNKKFVSIYADAQRAEPQMLVLPNWPIKIAERTATALGGAPLPVPGALGTPKPLQGSALDMRPK